MGIQEEDRKGKRHRRREERGRREERRQGRNEGETEWREEGKTKYWGRKTWEKVTRGEWWEGINEGTRKGGGWEDRKEGGVGKEGERSNITLWLSKRLESISSLYHRKHYLK